MLHHRSAKGGLRRGGLNSAAAFRSLPITKKKIASDQFLPQKKKRPHEIALWGFLRRNKRKKRQRKRVSMRSSSSQGGLRRGWKSPSRFLKPRSDERKRRRPLTRRTESGKTTL